MGKDPKLIVTETLAQSNEDPAICETKTRVMSRQQKEWDGAQARLVHALGWGWLQVEKIQDERLMMSHQGRRSDDLVEVAKSAADNRMLTRGIQSMREAFTPVKDEE